MAWLGWASDGPWLNEAPAAPEWWGQPPAQGSGFVPRSAVTGFAVSTSQRELVRLFHLSVHAASEGVSEGWAGDVASGVAGQTTVEFQDAVIRRVNYFRALCGVPAWVERSAEYGAKAQQAALMMTANGKLSHFPDMSWTFYTEAGAEAARNSNLYLGGHGPSSIDGYMLDPGANNAVVGHRRWILYPNTRHMGTGDIPPVEGFWPSNCLWVFDSAQSPTRPPTREAYVQWPPHGHVPYSLVPGRWSFAYPGADFTTATVTMQRDGVALPVTLEPLGLGLGDNALVWIPSGMNPDAADHPVPAADVRYSVTIAGVRISGRPATFNTEVVVFDPAKPGPDAVDTRPQGPGEVEVGVPTTFAIPEVPTASGYRWSRAPLTPSVQSWGAEDPAEPVIIRAAEGYETRVQEDGVQGGWCYRLAHPAPSTQTLTLDRTFFAGAGAELRFSKMLGLGTTGQVARAEVWVGGVWRRVWSEAGDGTGFAPPVSLAPVAVSLAEHAGKTLRVRFVYEAIDSWFPQTESGCGFYVDDVRVTGAEDVGAEVSEDVVADRLAFAAPQTGAWLLQAGPILFGDYFTGHGSGRRVQAFPVGGIPGLTLSIPKPGTGSELILEFVATGGVTGPFVVETTASVPGAGPWQAAPVSAITDLGGGRHRCTVLAAAGSGFFRVRTGP